MSRQLVRLDIPLMIIASGLVYGLALTTQFNRLAGAILLLGLLSYLGLLLRQSRHSGHHHVSHDLPRTSWLHNVLLMLIALVLLGAAGHLLLGAAVEVATELGLSERIIGLTIIAVSTSLPELATSLIAAFRGQREIAVGNVIGSNVFNLLGVLGVTALVAPAPLSVSPNAQARIVGPVMLVSFFFGSIDALKGAGMGDWIPASLRICPSATRVWRGWCHAS